MDTLRGWAVMLVFIALSGFIYYYLLPSGRVSDTAKAVFSVMTVAAVCLPLFGFFDGSARLFSELGAGGGGESYAPFDAYADIARATVEEKLSLAVKKYTDGEFIIETDINISDGMCIDIKQVSVIFEKYPEKLPELSLEIEDMLGITPHFILRENKDD